MAGADPVGEHGGLSHRRPQRARIPCGRRDRNHGLAGKLESRHSVKVEITGSSPVRTAKPYSSAAEHVHDKHEVPVSTGYGYRASVAQLDRAHAF